MAPRANWKGFLKIAELTCPVALYTAASTSDRIAFHTINRDTGHRVRRRFVDEETGDPVENEEQVKGYEVGADDYVVLEPDELAAAVPESDKTLSVSAFLPCGAVDTVYFDKPYYLAPSSAAAAESFAVIREGLRKKGAAALAHAVLFRRARTLFVRADGDGLVATTLNFDYEVRSAAEAFADIPPMRVEGEMLDLARHIIKTKSGRFDPSAFEDRYEAALAEMVKAKIEGRRIERPKPAPASKVVDLMEALRRSAGSPTEEPAPKAKRAPSKAGTAKRGTGKAGKSADGSGKTAAGAKTKKTAKAPSRRAAPRAQTKAAPARKAG
ncbi:Ku protein [Prosthecomicrobium pneumaticum]|uniref:Non-homologous end joining protein Ku n=1 Tax=Prosthecomicrobium pneumaticum TaxID=81895 RepID=A0A7W9FQD3_9HYPH|nr:Ku protein [Prosthecomicrobium pneumaticum]MBB5754930.1 DNA end-binding protein Ku [Prosthecomicrobium pneumaticum]